MMQSVKWIVGDSKVSAQTVFYKTLLQSPGYFMLRIECETMLKIDVVGFFQYLGSCLAPSVLSIEVKLQLNI